MERKRIRAGIEIECVYNSLVVERIELGGYHNGIKKGDFWGAEHDSSLYLQDDFMGELSGEVSSFIDCHHECEEDCERNDCIHEHNENCLCDCSGRECYAGCEHECDGDCYIRDCEHNCQEDECGGEGVRDNGRCAEFVSIKLKGKNSFFKAINEFKSFFNSDLNELDEVLSFNSSCGCHLHIGLNNNFDKYADRIDFKILVSMRELYFKKLKESKVLSEETKKSIKKHYYREGANNSYSQKLTEKKWVQRSGRSLEFNKQSEEQNRGLEWRGFNLKGVKSWAEFDEVFKIGWECLEFLFKKRVEGWNLKREIIKFPRAKYRELNGEKISLDIEGDGDSLKLELDGHLNKKIVEVNLNV